MKYIINSVSMRNATSTDTSSLLAPSTGTISPPSLPHSDAGDWALGTPHSDTRTMHSGATPLLTITFQGTEMEWPAVRWKFEATGSEQRCSQS